MLILPPQLEHALIQLVVVQQIKLNMLHIVQTDGRRAISFPPNEITKISS
jgi:arsenate reductase-like glutaredoxin family protein